MQTAKQGDLEKLAKALLEHETLTAKEIEQVLMGSFEKAPIAPKLDSNVEKLLGQGAPQSESI